MTTDKMKKAIELSASIDALAIQVDAIQYALDCGMFDIETSVTISLKCTRGWEREMELETGITKEAITLLLERKQAQLEKTDKEFGEL